MGLKVSHSKRWLLNTLLFRREPWKGRNVPAGVTNGSMLGTVNPNKLLRATSKYFGPFSPEQTIRGRLLKLRCWLVKPKLELSEPDLCWSKTLSYKLCWKHRGQHSSLHCRTMKRNYSIPHSWDPSPNPRNVHRDWYMQAVRGGIILYCLGHRGQKAPVLVSVCPEGCWGFQGHLWSLSSALWRMMFIQN